VWVTSFLKENSQAGIANRPGQNRQDKQKATATAATAAAAGTEAAVDPAKINRQLLMQAKSESGLLSLFMRLNMPGGAVEILFIALT